MTYDINTIALEDFIDFTDSMVIAEEGLKEVKNGLLHMLDVIAEKFRNLAIRIQYKIRELKTKKITKLSIPSIISYSLTKYKTAMNNYMKEAMKAVQDGNTESHPESSLESLENECKKLGTAINEAMSDIEEDENYASSYVDVDVSDDTFGLKAVLAMNKLITVAKNKARKGELPSYAVKHLQSCYTRVTFYNTHMYKGAIIGNRKKNKALRQEKKAQKKSSKEAKKVVKDM